MKLSFGGGLNEIQAPDILEASDGSVNFDLSVTTHSLNPRSPFDLKGTATNTGEVRGLLQLVKRDDTSTTLVQAEETVYKWDGATTWSSMGSVASNSQLRDAYWSLNDYIVVTDLQKETVVKSWDGTTFGTLTTGLGTDLYAKYATVHNGRMWLFNVKTSTDTPHLMVASAFENPKSYDTTQRAVTGTFTTGLEAFYMLTPDLRPINGVAKTVAGDLVISTLEGSLFVLTGSSATNYAWRNFYPGSQAIGNEAMTSTGNDVVYMRKGGNIESLNATQKYGDVETDDLSRWIKETVKDLRSSITVYDQTNQKVLFFITGKVLVLFKDILFGGALSHTGEVKKLSPWSVYTTTHDINFNTSVARYMRRPGTTDMSVYFGGTSGEVFDLNGTGTSGDGGTDQIQVVRKSRYIEDPSIMNPVTRGRVNYTRSNEVVFNIGFEWADEYSTPTSSMRLKGALSGGSYYGGEAYYGGAFYYGPSQIGFHSHQTFDVVGTGSGAVVTFSTLDSKPYQVDTVEFQ